MNPDNQRTPPVPTIDSLSATTILGRAITSFLVPMSVGVIQGCRYGYGQRDYGFLITASVLSIGSVIAYNRITVMRWEGAAKQLWMGLIVFSIFLPLAFHAYLAFYRGLWGFTRLFTEFNLGSLSAAIIFTLVGFRGAMALEMFTSLCLYSERLVKQRESGQVQNSQSHD